MFKTNILFDELYERLNIHYLLIKDSTVFRKFVIVKREIDLGKFAELFNKFRSSFLGRTFRIY